MLVSKIKGIWKFWLLIILVGVGCTEKKPVVNDPADVFPELFSEVQTSDIFDDSKYFADARSRKHPQIINRAYRQASARENFNLSQFVRIQFELPPKPATYKTVRPNDITGHIDSLWQVLSRPADQVAAGYSSLIALPFPYVVPGGRFREIYYWDSYFTMLGLVNSGKSQLALSMVENFAWLIDQFGFVPNGNRAYYLSRSQPPFFSLMVGLVAQEYDSSLLVRYHPQLKKEYDFWMDGEIAVNPAKLAYKRVVRMPDGSILNRYWDEKTTPRSEAYSEDLEIAKLSNQSDQDLYRNIRAACESGWDFSSRWLGDSGKLENIRTTEIVPVDLNSLLYNLELTLANTYQLRNKSDSSRLFLKKARHRKRAINKYLWNNGLLFYSDYDFKSQGSSSELTLAGVFPLFVNVAQPIQATFVSITLMEDFLKPGGFVTSLKETGQQWDYPNGWAPLQWVATKGLRNYDMGEFAERGERRWLRNVEEVYSRSGKILEKYNVVDLSLTSGGGEYPTQDGFGWTNGVYMRIKANQK